jgi:hydrogenase maturation protein HypF
MVDNGLKDPVIGVAFDGTGLGSDGNIWGGEFIVADYQHFTRKGHLEYLPLPGGTVAIKKPYRITIGYLLSLLGESALNPDLPFLKRVDSAEIDIIRKQIEQEINSPLSSSCGRLFDAVSALLGIRDRIEYEAQAAIELEMTADDSDSETGNYSFSITTQDGLSLIRLKDLFSSLLSELQDKVAKETIATRFHNTIGHMIRDLCQIISHQTGLTQVVLSGGVFQNRLLLRKATSLLEDSGFTVFTHRQVPCNDGGISLGQAVIANFNSE